MKVTKAKKMIKRLMTKHRVYGWKAYLAYNEIDAGATFDEARIIELYNPFFAENSKRICKDTILHEIAHVLAGGYEKMHGQEWKDVCVKIGAYPEEYLSFNNFPKLVMPRDETEIESMISFFSSAELPRDENEIIQIKRS